MFIRITLILTLLLFLPAANAEQSMKLTAHSYEIPAGSITLPEKAGRSVMIRACSNCPGKRHTITRESSFQVNDEQVSLAAMKTALEENPNALLVISYAIKNGDIVSILLIFESPSNSGNQRNDRNPRGHASRDGSS